MKLQPRGLYGALERMQELQARINVFSHRIGSDDAVESKPKGGPAGAGGPRPSPEISFAGALDSEFRPFDPMSPGVGRAIHRAPTDVRAMIRSAAESAGIDPSLFEALVGRESSFDPNAVSIAGAKGLAQLMPRTAQSLGVTDIFNPEQNLNAGARYLAQMLRQYGGDRSLALAAYNAGPGTVRQVGGIPEESAGYVRDVLLRAAEIAASGNGGQ